ncbi:ATP-dependent acyl-CoA ligase [Saccharopolyspora hirsuta]|uniref:ATP-dependent acyl-CoA ligase n=2 Tax=Saccharopolyspora hirsuta TaxID=1837 RepID=A0A5M7C9S0_SACHI|nr:ATP-dependent acyl-CoA ligase [Saccharopolyspora hirsuta]KAA5837197.1 ATP-dependent acyl-CoA ligase [Saccharopolyspora hirsuta]
MLDNRPEFLLAKLGAAMVPMNIRYQDYDATHVLAHSQPKLIAPPTQQPTPRPMDELRRPCSATDKAAAIAIRPSQTA